MMSAQNTTLPTIQLRITISNRKIPLSIQQPLINRRVFTHKDVYTPRKKFYFQQSYPWWLYSVVYCGIFVGPILTEQTVPDKMCISSPNTRSPICTSIHALQKSKSNFKLKEKKIRQLLNKVPATDMTKMLFGVFF